MKINKVTLLLALPIAAVLLVPSSALANDRHDDNRHHQYDKRHKDYHDFDDHEERAWRIYWQQQHRNYVDWDRASQRQRDDYWNWRHSHSDSLLQINIR